MVCFSYAMAVIEAWRFEATDPQPLLTKGGRLTLTKKVKESGAAARIERAELLARSSIYG